jgi:predicted ATP-binding protein involved in virulence
MAIQSFLPGLSDLRVKRSPLRMTLSKERKEVIINQLSDGEKCLLAMVGDLSRRLAIANPSKSKPLEGEAIILVDEIDLHLHPSWQRMIVPNLLKTFPFCQFILTTHSPQVISHVVEAENIFLMRCADGQVTVSHPESTYGLDTNYILQVVMNVPERPKEIKDNFEDLFRLIDRGKFSEARSKIDELGEKIGSDPALTKADVLIRRKETIGK